MQVSYREKQFTFDETMTVQQLLKKLKILPESVLVVRNGQLLTEDRPLAPEDSVKIVPVVSGG
ncbi:MAG TPA: MoaD/ThiS family protein [Anaerolineae bacterium]|nr:MoaD/ThiS family protein [Anaerolineae bacterium]HOV47118.1 MoaD/ThiS family protein [Anaerolineae bacterium]HPD40921.1 MoaD/ThiS family protein [Anaerolineae bacterium]HQJ10416.1 MoaD/ThiS family protein [Anaerolineae bacterium]HRT31932.1 MoaD/ThiS family protein [Anaerolineae bacterium]